MLFLLWLSHFCIYNFFGHGAVGLFLFPVLIAFALRAFFTPIFAYHIVLVFVVVLNLVSEVKFLISQKVLSFQDLVYLSQASDVHDFLPLSMKLLIGLTIATLFIPYKKLNFKWQLVPVPVALILGLYIYSTNLNFMANTNLALRKYADIRITFFNLRDNIKGNGILLHLAQTMGMSAKPVKGAHHFYKPNDTGNKRAVASNTLKGYDIFLVTCESCYFEDDKNSPLHNDFIRLIQEGYSRTSMISPVYGGNTSEAEFELLTGLPSKGLPGNKFQVYGSGFAEHVYSFPGFAKKSGYLSYYYHNTPRVHWNRDVALQKFSFESTYFIEDMNYVKDQIWARDFYLYDKVLAQYEESIKSPTPVYNQLMTVFSHGSYKDVDGDGGVADYNHKIAITLDDYFKFERKLRDIAAKANRQIVIFMVGDHKPSLNKVFFHSKTISPSEYRASDESVEKDDFRFTENITPSGLIEIGRVPFFVKVIGKDTRLASEIIKPLADKPLFCFPGYLASEIDITKSQFFARLKEVCDGHSPVALASPEWQRGIFTPQLFAEQLF